MAKDYAALQVELEGNARYTDAVAQSSLQPLLALLNANSSGTVAVSVSADAFREAVGDGIRGLTAAQIQGLRFMQSDGSVDLSRASIRQEIMEILEGKTAALVRLQAIATRPATFGDAFGFARVTKEDLWKVLPNVSTSYMATYQAGLAAKIAAAEGLHERHLQGADLDTYQDPGVVANG